MTRIAQAFIAILFAALSSISPVAHAETPRVNEAPNLTLSLGTDLRLDLISEQAVSCCLPTIDVSVEYQLGEQWSIGAYTGGTLIPPLGMFAWMQFEAGGEVRRYLNDDFSGGYLGARGGLLKIFWEPGVAVGPVIGKKWVNGKGRVRDFQIGPSLLLTENQWNEIVPSLGPTMRFMMGRNVSLY